MVFRLRISDTTKEAELAALMIMSCRQQLAYFVHMKEPSKTLDLEAALPHMFDSKAVQGRTLRRSAATIHASFNDNQRQALESLKTVPDRIFWMTGCPGAGKTHTALSFAALAQMSTKRVRVLYLVDMNNPVNDVAERMANLYEALGMNKVLVRMYGWPKEVRLAGQKEGDHADAQKRLQKKNKKKHLASDQQYSNVPEPTRAHGFAAAFIQMIKQTVSSGERVIPEVPELDGTLVHSGLEEEAINTVHVAEDATSISGIASNTYQTLDEAAWQYFRAIERGLDDHFILDLIDHYGASVDETNSKGIIPLQTTATCGRMKILRSLLDRGAEANTPGSLYQTPLHVAAKCEGVQKESLLVRLLRGDDIVNTVELQGLTPLQIACRSESGNVGLVETLLDYGAAIDGDRYSASPLYEAVHSRNQDVVKLLVNRGASISVQWKRYGTEMHALALGPRRGSRSSRSQTVIETAQLLFDNGVDINASHDTYGTPLQMALSTEQVQLARFLLERGADGSTISEVQMYWLFHIINRDSVVAETSYSAFGVGYTINRLLQDGRVMSQKEGHAAFERALAYGRWDLCHEVMKACPDMEISTENSLVALQGAAFEGKTEILRRLVDRGADVLAQGYRWGTPLIALCLHPPIDTTSIQFLIEKGVDVSFCHPEHGTALQTAITRGFKLLDPDESCEKSLKLLLKHSENISWTLPNGNTLIEVALRNNDLMAAHLLLDRGGPVTLQALNLALARSYIFFNEPHAVWQFNGNLHKAFIRQSKEWKEEILQWTIEHEDQLWRPYLETVLQAADPIRLVDFLWVSLDDQVA